MNSFALALLVLSADPRPPVMGAKMFSESRILAEIAAQLAEYQGVSVRKKPALVGSQVVWNAVTAGDIDAYPDYTGTLATEILNDPSLESIEAIRQTLNQRGLTMTESLGFHNNYAIGMRIEVARRLGIETISDLRDHPALRFGFSNEFMVRSDGWVPLRDRYRLPQTNVRGMDHSLAYQGMVQGSLDATDVYTTDASIEQFGLVVLRDDLQFFPPYEAVFVYRSELLQRSPGLVDVLRQLENRIDAQTMFAMNVRVDVHKQTPQVVAHDFLRTKFQIDSSYVQPTLPGRLLKYTLQHLFLVSTSLLAAIAVAIPLGVLSAKRPALGQLILSAAEIVQTIPGLALLVLLMPPFDLVGISSTGPAPVIVALFLYSLLPIIRNTYTGMHDIPHSLLESATALGLTPWAQLWQIELPMASRMILAGIKTTAVINVGYATLGGLIGAGGYGEPIMQGLQMSRTDKTLEGAIPAAILALLIKFAFELAERRLVPRGLRVSSHE